MSNIYQRRISFNEAAEIYNQIRPNYPAAIFRSLLNTTELAPGASVVEIGLGTGQATRPLTELGYAVTAVELGTALAAVAKRELAACPNVRILTGNFETVTLPKNAFDLVFAATAIHWITPEKRFAKPYDLLKPAGMFAVLETHHASDEKGNHFFHSSQSIYEKYYPDDKEGKPQLPLPDKIAPFEFDSSLFRQVHFQRYPQSITYTAHQYAKLLSTYSPTLELAPKPRADFLHDIEALINEKFGGTTSKQFVFTLTIACKI